MKFYRSQNLQLSSHFQQIKHSLSKSYIMPFTFSHPAIILPFQRLNSHYVSITGLIAGSIAPDFEYFIRMKMMGHCSHTALGALTIDLPITIIIALLFHQIVKKTLINHLPYYGRTRLEVLRQFNFWSYFKQNWWIFLLSAIIGIYSHILWDDFTHKTGYFVQQFPFLQSSISLEILGKKTPIYWFLQQGSTLIGGLLVVYYFHHQPKMAVTSQKIAWKYWLFLAIIALIIFSIRLYTFEKIIFGHIAVASISSILLSLIINGIAFRKH